MLDAQYYEKTDEIIAKHTRESYRFPSCRAPQRKRESKKWSSITTDAPSA